MAPTSRSMARAGKALSPGWLSATWAMARNCAAARRRDWRGAGSAWRPPPPPVYHNTAGGARGGKAAVYIGPPCCALSPRGRAAQTGCTVPFSHYPVMRAGHGRAAVPAPMNGACGPPPGCAAARARANLAGRAGSSPAQSRGSGPAAAANARRGRHRPGGATRQTRLRTTFWRPLAPPDEDRC
jgi:hypothetical protein